MWHVCCGGVECAKALEEAAGWTSAVARERQEEARGPAYIAKSPGELDQLSTLHCQPFRQWEGLYTKLSPYAWHACMELGCRLEVMVSSHESRTKIGERRNKPKSCKTNCQDLLKKRKKKVNMQCDFPCWRGWKAEKWCRPAPLELLRIQCFVQGHFSRVNKITSKIIMPCCCPSLFNCSPLLDIVKLDFMKRTSTR